MRKQLRGLGKIVDKKEVTNSNPTGADLRIFSFFLHLYLTAVCPQTGPTRRSNNTDLILEKRNNCAAWGEQNQMCKEVAKNCP